jgi:hypothetical protein
MKRLVVFVALMLSCSFLVPLSASARFGDSARGSGETVLAERFSFRAEGFGGAGSTNATGTWKHTRTHQSPLGASTFEGTVRCLLVLGNQASFVGFITKSSSPGLVGNPVLVHVEDNNGAGEDRYRFMIFSVGFPPECTATLSTDPIVRGDIEVVASTFPT